MREVRADAWAVVRPIRPSLPPSAWVACGVWVGVSLAEAHWWALYQGKGTAAGSATLAGLVLVGLLFLARKRAVVLLIVSGLCAGALCGALFWARWNSDLQRLCDSGSTNRQADVITDARRTTFAAASEIVLAGGVHARCTWPRSGRAGRFGERVSFYGTVRPAGADEFGRMDHRDGIVGSVNARSVRRLGGARGVRGLLRPVREAASRALGRVPGSAGAVLSGVVIGDKTSLRGTSVEADFRTSGLSHLLAVSGTHLAVVTALVSSMVSRLPVRRAVSLSLLLTILAGYVVLSGLQSSAIRAWLMACVVLWSRAGFRRSDGLAALSSVCCLTLCLWPPSAFDLGFRLSVAAVAGLLMFGRLAEEWVSCALPRPLQILASPAAVAITAQVATAPIALPVFGRISLISPVANVLAVPLITAALTGGVVGVALNAFSERAGHVVLMCAGACANACIAVAHRLSAVPHAEMVVGGGAGVVAGTGLLACCLAWAVWPRATRSRSRLVGIGLVMLLMWPLVGMSADTRTRVVVLDVGQGDSVLVTSKGESMLIDTGPSERSMRDALVRCGIRRLDWLVLTHLHSDHTGGLKALQGTVPVENLAVAAGADVGQEPDLKNMAARAKRCMTLRAGQRLTVGEFNISVLSPRTRVADGADNDSSIVLLVSAPGLDVLLTGDAEADVLRELIRRSQLGDIGVLKVGHHGSADAVNESVLSAMDPEVAIVSAGGGNRFGHPAPSTIRDLQSAGARLYRTDRDGDVTVVAGPSGPIVVR